VPTESYSDSQHAGYFLRTLWALLLVLGYSEPCSSSEPEVALLELVPLAFACGDLQEAYD
jgi:hypothetical protein